MPLKSFHILFIFFSVALCIFFGYWAVLQHLEQTNVPYLLTGIASFLVGAGLICYGTVFKKKIEKIEE